MHVEVEGDGDDVEVAGAFAVAEQGALDAFGAGEHGQFGGGDAGAAVVVGVDADDRGIAPRQMADEPLDLVRVHVGHRDLHGVGKIQDHLGVGRGLPHVHDGRADLDGELDLGGGEAFRRILEADVGAGEAGQAVLDPLGAAARHLQDLRLAQAKHDAALGGRGGVVEMDDGAFRADQGLDGAFDEVLAGLDEDLDGDVVGNALVLDQAAHEGELGVGGGGETDLDLLEAALHERIEHLELLGDVHGHGERLVAVAEIDAAPGGRRGQDAVGPLAIGQVDRREWPVLGCGFFQHGFSVLCFMPRNRRTMASKTKNPTARAAEG